MSESCDEDLKIPVKAEKVVPHRRPVCLIDHLVEYEEQSGVSEAFITAENPLVNDTGVLDSTAYVELIAQTYAAFKGYHDLIHKRPVRKGFLVAVRQMETRGESRLGDLLNVKVETISEVGDFAVARGTVTRQDEILASGNLTLWVPESSDKE